MPIFSMTAFAHQQIELLNASLSCTIRSVNHRFLELNLKLPEVLQHLEPTIRDKIRRKISRGKMDIHLKLERHQSWLPQINHELAEQLLKLCNEIDSMARHSAPVDALKLLNMPGVLEFSQQETLPLEEHVISLLNSTLESFIATRRTEGESLLQIMLERLALLSKHLDNVRETLPELLQVMRNKMEIRLQELVSNTALDPHRIHQELVLWAQRIDVAEELDRLQLHTTELRHTLIGGGNIGKKADFLLQELHREANTLTSKSLSAQSTHWFVDIKLCVEQLREQIQNIE